MASSTKYGLSPRFVRKVNANASVMFKRMDAHTSKSASVRLGVPIAAQSQSSSNIFSRNAVPRMISNAGEGEPSNEENNECRRSRAARRNKFSVSNTTACWRNDSKSKRASAGILFAALLNSVTLNCTLGHAKPIQVSNQRRHLPRQSVAFVSLAIYTSA